MRAFEFHKATSRDALTALAARSDGPRGPDGTLLLAGGQTLLPRLRARAVSPDRIVDIKPLLSTTVELEPGASGRPTQLSIGAGATHADLATDDTLSRVAPALTALAAHVGDPSVRNRGTLGGSLARPHPAGDWPAAALALRATLVTDRREIEFAALGDAPLADDGELLERVRFDVPERAAYAKFLHPAQRYALVGVFVANVGSERRVAVTGVSERGAMRWPAAEAYPEANPSTLPSAVAIDAVEARGDAFGSPAYRSVLAARLLGLARRRLHEQRSEALVLVHGQRLEHPAEDGVGHS